LGARTKWVAICENRHARLVDQRDTPDLAELWPQTVLGLARLAQLAIVIGFLLVPWWIPALPWQSCARKSGPAEPAPVRRAQHIVAGPGVRARRDVPIAPITGRFWRL